MDNLVMWVVWGVICGCINVGLLKWKSYGSGEVIAGFFAGCFLLFISLLICIIMPDNKKKLEQQQLMQMQRDALKNMSQPSSADELLKLKNLYDAGAITQEEYESKRSQLVKKL